MTEIIYQIEDAKHRETTFKAIVEDCLTKRPYNKILVLTLLEDPSLNDGRVDIPSIVR